MNQQTRSPLVIQDIRTMVRTPITDGPVKDELVTRMLSNLPVTFQTSNGPVEVLLEEMREADASINQMSWHGRLVTGMRTGARVHGEYDCLSRKGTLSVGVDGA